MNTNKHFKSVPKDDSQSRDELIESLNVKSITQYVINKPENINDQEGQLGWTYLYKAVVLENYDLCEFLIENNANPNLQNYDGESPLHHAVESGNNKIINLLLENGANPNIQQKVYYK